MELIESSETSAYINTLTPGTYPKEKKLQSKHGESLKSRIDQTNLRNLVIKNKILHGTWKTESRNQFTYREFILQTFWNSLLFGTFPKYLNILMSPVTCNTNKQKKQNKYTHIHTSAHKLTCAFFRWHVPFVFSIAYIFLKISHT